jgi:DNA-binding transcriptional LysR family regulator
MQLYQLHQFQIMAKCEHMSKAAELLHISQPTLSLNLSRLEDELKVKLFDRIGRNIKLNKYGKSFLYHLERALEELETGKKNVRMLYNEETIRTADALLANAFKMFESYLEKHPNINFSQQTCTLPEIWLLLESKSIDMAFVLLDPDFNLNSNMVWHTIQRSKLMAMVSVNHPFAARSEISLSELKDQPITYSIPGFDARDSLDKYCNSVGFTPNYIFTSIKTALFIDFMRSKNSVSIVLETIWKLSPEHRPDGVVGIKIKDPYCYVDFGILTLKGYQMSKQANNFLKYSIDFIKNNPIRV